MQEKLPKVEIYSDGGARPNPGPGGYGVILKFGDKTKELSGFEENTTNNKMELTGVIVGLKALKTKCEVDIYTDSSYVVNSIEKGWVEKWKKNNWMRTKTQKAQNWELWEELLSLILKHKVKFHWVKGHAGHKENERCDELATKEILKNKTSPQPSPLEEREQEHQKYIFKNNKTPPSSKTPLKKGRNNDIKIKKVGDACKKCLTPVEKKVPKKINSKNKKFYYKYYLTCPNCKTNYFLSEAKVML